MLVKKYEAKDMQQAMDDIVKELGSDAVILNSRKIRKKGLANLFQKPIVEVMVAYEPKKPANNGKKPNPAIQQAAHQAYGPLILGGNNTGPATAPPNNNAQSPAPSNTHVTAPATMPNNAAPISSGQTHNAQPNNHGSAFIPASTTPGTQPFSPRLLNNTHGDKQGPPLSDIDSRLTTLDNVLNDFMHKFAYIKRDVTYNFSPEVEELLLTMSSNEVREELAFSLAKETEEILKARPDARPREVMQHLICECIGATAPIALKKYKQKVILLLGPTGVGKTTSLVKLASHFAINQKKKVGIINTDTYRIAAHEQLRIYADILDIPLGIAYRMDDLTEALTEMSSCDVIFIDTAGKRPGDPQHKEDIKTLIEYAQPEDILLCVAAPTSFSAIAEIVDTYSFISDYRLLITKMDETKYRGMVLNIAHYAKKPLSYMATGQNVPDDLEAADTELLARQILER